MSRKRKRHATRSQQQAAQNTSAIRTSPYIRWGVTAIIGSIILMVMAFFLYYASYVPQHRGSASDLTAAINYLKGPLTVEGLALLLGIVMLVIGLRQYQRLHTR